jgi:hypothetical protein
MEVFDFVSMHLAAGPPLAIEVENSKPSTQRSPGSPALASNHQEVE